MTQRGFWLEVTGENACFTRPEMKVERVSYDVITPSSARAIFDAILWKPAIFWKIKEIRVMNPIKWITVRRNEVANIASERSDGIFIEDSRQQRAGLFLRDVRYLIRAEFDFIPPDKRGRVFNPVPEFLWENDPEYYNDQQLDTESRPDETSSKYAAMFERRAKKGQWFHKPYLGCREFAADFRLLSAQDAMLEESPIRESRDLGWMLYDLDFSNPQDIKPLFFRAEIQNGVIIVPDRNDKETVRG